MRNESKQYIVLVSLSIFIYECYTMGYSEV